MFTIFVFLVEAEVLYPSFLIYLAGLFPRLPYRYKSRVFLHLRLRERNLFPVGTVQSCGFDIHRADREICSMIWLSLL